MGLDQDRVIEKDALSNHLICSICTDVVENPMLTPCQHSFCSECIRGWLNDGNSTCPEDRQPLQIRHLKTSRLLQELLSKFTIRCKNHKNGCPLMVKFPDMSKLIEHEENSCSLTGDSLRQENEKLKKQINDLEERIVAKNKKILEMQLQHGVYDQELNHNRIMQHSQEKTIQSMRNKLVDQEKTISTQETLNLAELNSDNSSFQISVNVTSSSACSANSFILDIPKDIVQVEPNFVAFGPNGSWVALTENGRIFWSEGLPSRLRNLLNGRYGSKQKNSPVTMLAYDKDSHIVFFETGSNKRFIWDDNLENDLEQDLDASFGPPSYIAISYSTNGYVMNRGDDEYFDVYSSLPDRMRELFKTKKNAAVTWAALGNQEDSFFLLYSDGRCFYENLPKKLEDTLRNLTKPIQRICLSQFDERYLLLFKDGSYEYQYTNNETLPTCVKKPKREIMTN